MGVVEEERQAEDNEEKLSESLEGLFQSMVLRAFRKGVVMAKQMCVSQILEGCEWAQELTSWKPSCCHPASSACNLKLPFY